MDGVYKELDEVKAELENLKEQYRIKSELSESLRRAYGDQTAKFQEAQSQIERQAKELNDKSEEMEEMRRVYDDIKSKLHETESSLKQASYVNDKFRVESGEKMEKLEGEKRKMVSDLEEATGRNEDLERKLRARNEEVDGLKTLLSDSQRKFLEAEEKARAGKELRQRDDVISSLEEQRMNIQDQLKWKKEQFEHLEEAHKRLQDQFQLSKEEWASEKVSLLEEVSTLQSKLDSQVRITESLESRLKMCNQALAHEESKRKMLDVQLSESKRCFENVFAECEEAKARIESLSAKRDEEIAGLRNSIGKKETLMKELEYRVAHLEQENKELLGSLKELQEAQINKRKPDTSLTKLRNKLKVLELVHNNCGLTLNEREAEWNSKMEKLIGDLKCCESELKTQTEQMQHLKIQLESYHSAMEVSGEENSILLMVLKSELTDAYLKIFNSKAQLEASNNETGEKIAAVSTNDLQMGHGSTIKAQVDLKQARAEIASLTQKLDSLKILEEQSTFLENELVKNKRMLEESSDRQLRLKEHVCEMEAALQNVSNALEKSNSDLAAKITEASKAETELQIWKSKAESLRTSLEQNQKICKQMETTLLEQVDMEQGLRKENESLQCRLKEQDKKIEDLQEEVVALDQKLVQAQADNEVIKVEAAEAHKKEKYITEILKERDATVENLRKEIEEIEQQSVRRESEAAESTRLETENKFLCEKENLYSITRQKDERMRSLEQNFMDMVLDSLSQGVENMVKMIAFEEALKKTESRMNAAVERKNKALDVLKMEASDLRAKVLLLEQSLFQSRESAEELEGLLGSKKIEMENLVSQSRDEQAKLKNLVENLEKERETATDKSRWLSSERESLLAYVEELCEHIGGFCAEDVKLERMLGQMLQNLDKDARFTPNVISDKLCIPTKKDANHTRLMKGVEANIDRSPLREVNH